MITFLLVSTLIRLPGLFTASIWYDEAVSKYRASLPWSQYLHDQAEYIGVNLWEIMLRPFAHGPVWLLRLPALACAIVSLACAWRLMEIWKFTRIQKYIGAVSLAILPSLLWMSQDARYYSAVAALYLVGLVFAMENKQLGLIACAGLLAYVHPVGSAYGITLFLVEWIAGMKFDRVLLSGSLAALAWLPRYLAIFLQPAGMGEFWLQSIDTAYVLNQSIMAAFVGTLNIFTMLMVIVGFPAVIVAFAFRSKTGIPLVGLFLPAFIMLIVSNWMPVYFYRPIHPLAYSLCLFLPPAVAPGKRWYTWIGVAALGGILLSSALTFDPATRGGHIDQAATQIRSGWQDGDKIVYVAPLTALPFNYYLPDLDHCILDMDIGLNVGPNNLQGFEMCQLETLDHGRTWLVWIREPQIPETLHAALRERTAGLAPVAVTDAWQFAPIEVYLVKP